MACRRAEVKLGRLTRAIATVAVGVGTRRGGAGKRGRIAFIIGNENRRWILLSTISDYKETRRQIASEAVYAGRRRLYDG